MGKGNEQGRSDRSLWVGSDCDRSSTVRWKDERGVTLPRGAASLRVQAAIRGEFVLLNSQEVVQKEAMTEG